MDYSIKKIDTGGIEYIEPLSGSDWYWGCDYASGDLYEAEEVYRDGHEFRPNRLIFVHYPDGTVYEPIVPEKGQYFGCPIYCKGDIFTLLADFPREKLEIIKLGEDMAYCSAAEIALGDICDCYNLLLHSSPLMLTRQGGDNKFQIIWPRKSEFEIGETESLMFADGNKLYFSVWSEEPDYHEQIVVRDTDTGEISERFDGAILTMPDGQLWNLS